MLAKSSFRGIPVIFILLLLLYLAFVASEAAANEDDQSAVKPARQVDKALLEKVEKAVESNRDQLIELYRDFPRHPEVSGRYAA